MMKSDWSRMAAMTAEEMSAVDDAVRITLAL